MDRREALKKLATGGAIAAGGSFVLSSNAVAYAASGPPVVSGIPEEGQPLPVSIPPFSNSSGILTISDASIPIYTGGGTSVQTTHAWRINGYTLSQNSATGIEIRSGGLLLQAAGNPSCTSGCGDTSYHQGTDTADVQPTAGNGKNKKFKSGNAYDIGLLIEWLVPGVQTITAEFQVSGTIGGSSTATMVPGSYRIS
jgi:hypothetical protein